MMTACPSSWSVQGTEAELSQLPTRCVAEEASDRKSSPSWSCPEIIKEEVLSTTPTVSTEKRPVAALYLPQVYCMVLRKLW